MYLLPPIDGVVLLLLRCCRYSTTILFIFVVAAAAAVAAAVAVAVAVAVAMTAAPRDFAPAISLFIGLLHHAFTATSN